MSLLPPCKDALYMHIKRAAYQAKIWYTSDKAFPNISSPRGQGWELNQDGELCIKWTEGDLLPQELVAVLTEEPETESDAESPELENLEDAVFTHG